MPVTTTGCIFDVILIFDNQVRHSCLAIAPSTGLPATSVTFRSTGRTVLLVGKSETRNKSNAPRRRILCRECFFILLTT